MERTNTMNALDIMKRPAAYVSGYENTPTEEQNRAKQLCGCTPSTVALHGSVPPCKATVLGVQPHRS